MMVNNAVAFVLFLQVVLFRQRPRLGPPTLGYRSSMLNTVPYRNQAGKVGTDLTA
jgi:hypothetical protein